MPDAKSAKEVTRALLDRLDDDVTFEDILYELHVLQKIEQGRQDAADGHVTSHEDVRDELNQWLR
jgi:predicted transcriptional regulator